MWPRQRREVEDNDYRERTLLCIPFWVERLTSAYQPTSVRSSAERLRAEIDAELQACADGRAAMTRGLLLIAVLNVASGSYQAAHFAQNNICHRGRRRSSSSVVASETAEASLIKRRTDFALLDQSVWEDKPLVYLDSAATSQKPAAVIDAMARHLTRDTATWAPLMRTNGRGKRKPRKLRDLVKEHLGRTIQEGEHGSVEDATAAMDLYKLFAADWEASLRSQA